MDPRVTQLAQVPFFAQFTEPELEDLAELIQVRHIRKDTVIFHEQDPGLTFYVIKQGRVKVYKNTEDGRELILGIFGDGGIIGDVPVFDGGPYPASAASLAETELYAIKRESFEQLINSHPEVALKIIRVLGRRLRQAHELVRDMALKNVAQRLAGLLLRLIEEYGVASDRRMVLDLPLSRQEMADMMGVSRETATRELSRFAKTGLIEVDGRRITILEEKKLRLWSRV